MTPAFLALKIQSECVVSPNGSQTVILTRNLNLWSRSVSIRLLSTYRHDSSPCQIFFFK